MHPATVLCRPSATNKSPYVCDIVLDSGEKGMCHSPGLGCSGLVATGRRIWVTRNASATTKTAFTAQIAECTDAEGAFTVGIHPLISQKAAGGLLDRLGFGPGITWETEVFVDDHTRLDFVGTDSDGRKIYVEVKNAMISHEVGEKPRAIRRAIFPEGFRKKKDDPVSPRAVKHANTLAALTARPETRAAVLLYVIPRDDCGGGLEINPTDRVYSMAVGEALSAGVQARVFSLRFLPGDASIRFDKEAPLFVPGVKVRVVRRRPRLLPLEVGPEGREDAKAGALNVS
jgi:DNA-binding sugar fermentation-stimulating protein